jgi:hypothetical protein
MWENAVAEPIEPPAAHPEQELRMTGVDWLKENLQRFSRFLRQPSSGCSCSMVPFRSLTMLPMVITVERKDLNAVIWNSDGGHASEPIFYHKQPPHSCHCWPQNHEVASI